MNVLCAVSRRRKVVACADKQALPPGSSGLFPSPLDTSTVAFGGSRWHGAPPANTVPWVQTPPFNRSEQSGQIMNASFTKRASKQATAAEAAGLERGDIITAINGESVDSMKLEDISKRIRGLVGTNLTLTVSRHGEERDFDVVRKEITIKTVASRMMENKVGYIRIASFSSGTAEEFAEAYKALKEDGMTGLIVDVRNNPGGLVDQAAGVADYLLPEGSTVVTFSQRNDEDQVFTTKAAGVKIPLVVLVNENSASASEILAGDVQDLHAGVIIGTKTYGKGTVQAVYPVDDDSAVKVTIAKYKTASGREVDGTGIEPDVVVPLEANDNTDYQLQKALETIQSMQENR